MSDEIEVNNEIDVDNDDFGDSGNDLETSRREDLKSAFEDAGEEVSSDEQPSKTGYPEWMAGKKPEDAPKENDDDDEPILTPLSWQKAHKEEFKALPRNIQKIIAVREGEREAAFTRRMQEAAEAQRSAQELLETITPYQQKFALEGRALPTILQQMFEWHGLLEQDPRAGLLALARSYGLSPQELVSVASQQQQSYSPEYLALQQRLMELEGSLSEREERAHAELYGNLVSEVERFAEETDASGKVLRPYISHVYLDMQPIVTRLRAENPTASPSQILQEAYDRACYANPEVRDALLQQQRQADETKRREEAKKKAKQARHAGASVTGSPTGSSSPAKPDDLRGLLEAAINGGL